MYLRWKQGQANGRILQNLSMIALEASIIVFIITLLLPVPSPGDEDFIGTIPTLFGQVRAGVGSGLLAYQVSLALGVLHLLISSAIKPVLNWIFGFKLLHESPGGDARISDPLLMRAQIDAPVELFGFWPVSRRAIFVSVGLTILSAALPLWHPSPLPLTPPSILGPFAMTDIERSLPPARLGQIQSTLCVDSTGSFGTPGSETRNALRDFNTAYNFPEGAVGSDKIEGPRDLQRLDDARRKFPSCEIAGFRNAFEVGIFSRFGSEEVLAQIRRALNVAGLPDNGTRSGSEVRVIDPSLRDSIVKLRSRYNLPRSLAIDRDLYSQIVKLSPP
jgi:hypothetical protein